ncbi:MAG: lysophospholipase [Cytophagales bacterium]|nr:lysophospholipase [Cytophagales bacterium]
MKTIIQPKQAVFQSSTGEKIFYRNWKSENPQSLVVIVHGLNSHSGYYQNFAATLAAQNHEVVALDLRGRGKSEGERFFIGDYQLIIDDIDKLVDIAKSLHPTLPVFLLGHSAGGVFASVYALQHQQKLNGLISESFAFHVPAPAFAQALLKFMATVAPHKQLIQLNNADFSRNLQVVAQMNSDPLIAGEKQPAKTMQQLIVAGKQLGENMAHLKLPLLILHGTADKATLPSGSEYFLANATSTHKLLKLYEGHYHDLLNDDESEVVIQDILDWLQQRIQIGAYSSKAVEQVY